MIQRKGELLDTADMARALGMTRQGLMNVLREGRCPVKAQKRVDHGPYLWRPVDVYSHFFGPPASYADIERWVSKLRQVAS